METLLPADPAQPILSVRNLVKEFERGAVAALRDVSFDVDPGSVTVLVGRSGAGKTTLLRCINGLEKPTGGTVTVFGNDLDTLSSSELRALRRRIGFVFQGFNLVGRATALENVLSGALGRLRGPRYGVMSYGADLRKEAIQYLDRVGLADKAFQRADTLSGASSNGSPSPGCSSEARAGAGRRARGLARPRVSPSGARPLHRVVPRGGPHRAVQPAPGRPGDGVGGSDHRPQGRSDRARPGGVRARGGRGAPRLRDRVDRGGGLSLPVAGDRPVRPPVTWRSLQLPLLSLAVLALFVIALVQTDSSPARFVGSLDDLANLFARMWPPVATEWPRYLEATWITGGMVVAATGLGFLISVPVAILAARNTTRHPVVHAVARGLVALARAIPSIVWALLLVRAIGIGPVAGVLAMTLSSFGMLGKLFADAIEEVDPKPLDALTATGASRIQVFVGGVLPQVLATWLSLSLFRLDINVRRSVILGFVGAGGIGFELQRVLGQLAYRAFTIVAIIFVFVIALERLSAWVRSTLINGTVESMAVHAGRRR